MTSALPVASGVASLVSAVELRVRYKRFPFSPQWRAGAWWLLVMFLDGATGAGLVALGNASGVVARFSIPSGIPAVLGAVLLGLLGPLGLRAPFWRRGDNSLDFSSRTISVTFVFDLLRDPFVDKVDTWIIEANRRERQKLRGGLSARNWSSVQLRGRLEKNLLAKAGLSDAARADIVARIRVAMSAPDELTRTDALLSAMQAAGCRSYLRQTTKTTPDPVDERLGIDGLTRDRKSSSGELEEAQASLAMLDDLTARALTCVSESHWTPTISPRMS